jgi:hypothetical protein
MATSFAAHLLPLDDHASRPSASAVPQGTLYPCSDHGLIYQSDGTSTWTTWALQRSAEILDLETAETDTDLVLAPDGAGGVEWVASGGAGVQAAHGCRVVRASGNFAIGNNTYTEVEFNGTDTYDTDSMHDPSSANTRITIPSISGVTTGLWLISAGGYSTPVTRIDAQIRKNAAGNPASGTSLGFDLRQSTTAIQGYQLVVQAVLAAADYVECFVRSVGGSADIAFDAEGSPRMEVSFLGKVT